MTNTKFRLLEDETIEFDGKTLYRIEALKDFSSVKKGEKGGFVEKESNLSVDGNAWVAGNARVNSHAWIDGNARVAGNARVNGHARVAGNARVNGHAWIDGHARVAGNARVNGHAWIDGNARVNGHAWIDGNARVAGNARVNGHAWIDGNARVNGHAWIDGHACVDGNARVNGHAWIDGHACVDGNAWIESKDDLLIIEPIGSEKGVLTAFKNKKGSVSVSRGCFSGTLEEFVASVDKTHGDNKYANIYRIAVELIKAKLENVENKK